MNIYYIKSQLIRLYEISFKCQKLIYKQHNRFINYRTLFITATYLIENDIYNCYQDIINYILNNPNIQYKKI
jgi:hypothetical protein